MIALLNLIVTLITLYIWVLVIGVVLSWLIAFNVINTYNEGVRKFLYWLERLTDPLYKPVRAILPDFGGIDFSPIVVILVLYLIQGLLLDLQMQTVAL